MWILNGFLAWILWRQADAMYEMGTVTGKVWAWLCVVFSAANAAIFAVRLF